MATAPRDEMDRRAVVDPMLMQASAETTTKETMTARTGMFQPAWTCSIVSVCAFVQCEVKVVALRVKAMKMPGNHGLSQKTRAVDSKLRLR